MGGLRGTGEGIRKKTHKSHTLHNVRWWVFAFVLICCRKKASLTMAEQGTDQWVQQNVISRHFNFYILFFLSKNSETWLNPWSMGYLVTDSWLPKQCQVCTPSPGVGLKSNQILVAYSQNICATVTLHVLKAGHCRKRVWGCAVFKFLLGRHTEYFPVAKALAHRDKTPHGHHIKWVL